MIFSVTYGRTYNLGNYESLRLEAVASVQDDNVAAAFEEARAEVEAEYTRQRNPQPRTPPPATPKQRSYIATLQDEMTWTSEQLAAYASEQGLDLVSMTVGQASAFIEGLKRLAEERSTPTRADKAEDIPF